MRVLLLIVAMMLVVAPAMAMGTDNYSQDFESFEDGSYAPVDLANGNTQAFGNGNWIVGSTPLGEKSIKPTAANDLYLPYMPTSGEVKFVDGTVASIDARMDSSIAGSYFTWNINKNDGGAPFAGLGWYGNDLIVAQGGYGWAYVGTTYGTIQKDRNYNLTATFDFTNQMVAYGVNDIANPSASFSFNFAMASEMLPWEGNPGGTHARKGGFYMSGPGCVFDNLAVTTVPEPGSMLALGTGLIGLMGVIRRRK